MSASYPTWVPGMPGTLRDSVTLEGHNTSGVGVMSPFEKKIATYQKSAELRKATNERSGSRGRLPMSNTGTNFYPSQYRNDHLNNP